MARKPRPETTGSTPAPAAKPAPLSPHSTRQLLVLGVAGPAQATEGDVRLMKEVARCLPLVYDAPRDALVLADRLLSLPALPSALRRQGKHP